MPDTDKHQEISAAIREYLAARRKLFDVAEKHPDEMRGNDNVIGRIGEYLALQFLRSKQRLPTKTLNLSQKGFDLEEGRIRISVKLLTTENRRGRGARLTESWDELILILLNTSDLSGTIGFITRQSFIDAGYCPTAQVTSRMLQDGALFDSYGERHIMTSML